MKRAAGWVTALALVLELSAAAIFLWSRPQWAKTVLRAEYSWLWEAANVVTGCETCPVPGRFK